MHDEMSLKKWTTHKNECTMYIWVIYIFKSYDERRKKKKWKWYLTLCAPVTYTQWWFVKSLWKYINKNLANVNDITHVPNISKRYYKMFVVVERVVGGGVVDESHWTNFNIIWCSFKGQNGLKTLQTVWNVLKGSGRILIVLWIIENFYGLYYII